MNPTTYPKTIVKTAKQAKYKSGKLAILIKFPFSEETLKQVRSLPDRKWHPEEKHWSCPLCFEAVEKLKSFGFKLDVSLENFLKEKIKPAAQNISSIQIQGLPLPLYPFQTIGVNLIEQHNGRVLLADEMGLGKTIQTLAWLHLHPELTPIIIVMPASLKLNWNREIQRWLPNNFVQILSGTKTKGTKLLGKIILINYDILPYWVSRLTTLINPKVVILDECHYFKNNKAKRTKAVKQLTKAIPHVLCLSGTPIVNRPIEIFNAIYAIDSTLFPSVWRYAHRYCNAKHNGYSWDFNGASNTQELHEKLSSTIMIRRLKRDVLKDLPSKIYSFVPIELESEKEYQRVEADFISYIKQVKGKAAAERASNAAILTEIETLKQVAVKNKLKQAINWIKDFLESDQKLVIFAIHHFVIEALLTEFNDVAVKVDGEVSQANRQKAIDEFQNNSNIRLFIGNIQAAGVGITLTAASNVAFLELPWTPGELTQAEDRCHRIGQQDRVNIYYLLANNTIEEEIAALLDKKRKVLDSVLDGKDTEQESLLTQIINKY